MKPQPRALPTRGRPYICTFCARSLQLRPRAYATKAPPEIYDVVCVGGGPAGLSLLTALRMEEKYRKTYKIVFRLIMGHVHRILSFYFEAQDRPYRSSRSRRKPQLGVPSQQLFKSRELTHAFYRILSFPDRCLASCRFIPCSIVPQYASVGRSQLLGQNLI